MDRDEAGDPPHDFPTTKLAPTRIIAIMSRGSQAKNKKIGFFIILYEYQCVKDNL
jgi:hypothetical protein